MQTVSHKQVQEWVNQYSGKIDRDCQETNS